MQQAGKVLQTKEVRGHRLKTYPVTDRTDSEPGPDQTNPRLDPDQHRTDPKMGLESNWQDYDHNGPYPSDPRPSLEKGKYDQNQLFNRRKLAGYALDRTDKKSVGQ